MRSGNFFDCSSYDLSGSNVLTRLIPKMILYCYRRHTPSNIKHTSHELLESHTRFAETSPRVPYLPACNAQGSSCEASLRKYFSILAWTLSLLATTRCWV